MDSGVLNQNEQATGTLGSRAFVLFIVWERSFYSLFGVVEVWVRSFYSLFGVVEVWVLYAIHSSVLNPFHVCVCHMMCVSSHPSHVCVISSIPCVRYMLILNDKSM